MTDPDATLVGLFGFAQNANIYNVTLRDYDIVHAGEKALRKSVGAILAVAGSGARSYDNFCYPREEAEAVEAYYQDRNLPEFKKAFALLEEDKQRDYLERSYADGAIALFSEAVSCLPVDSPMIDEFAQRAYAEQETAFFSILTGNMSRNALEKWLERAASDRQTAFYSILSGAPGQKPEPPEISKEEEAQRLDAYRAHGITQEGAVYYYQGEIVGILLDIHSDNSFVFLNMNPEGTANIKITRDRDDAIMQVSRMTAKEVEELFREDEKESFAEGPEIERPEIEELPAAVQREMNNCSIRTWYVLAYDGREYIWYNGFAWEYAWKYDYEMWQKEGVRIDIVKLKKKDAGYVLLSVPEGDTLQLSVDGELVEYTELAVR